MKWSTSVVKVVNSQQLAKISLENILTQSIIRNILSVRLCTEKQFSNMTFICEYCGTNISQKGNLKRHINSIHEVINFKCERCKFTTTCKDKLREHINSNRYQKKFKCLECSTEFSRNDNLAKHMKNHLDLSSKDSKQLSKDIKLSKDETSMDKCEGLG